MKKVIIRQINSSDLNIGDIHPVLNRIYQTRGVKTEEDIKYDLKNLLSYKGLLNIDKATSILYESLLKKDKIIIVGDYDADGATSTALAFLALKSMGFSNVDYLIPNRFENSYGFSPQIARRAVEKKADLIVTVDNGITSHDGVNEAKQFGIKIMVTDHHLPSDTTLNADVIINPNQKGDTFKSKDMAGVSVIFYVMLAFRNFLKEKKWFTDNNLSIPNMGQFLDLVALGTICDLVNLDKNNRILVDRGISFIRSGKCRLGIKQLIKEANKDIDSISSADLGYFIGPRLNAAGRLEDMSLGVECLLTNDKNKVAKIAKKLDGLNKERRSIELSMHKEACSILNNLVLEKKIPMGLCLFEPAWHQGVIGLLASRIKEKTNRPTIVFAKGDKNEIKGSARSIKGLHIKNILENIAKDNPNLISRFGGHAMAAGISINLDKYEEFALAFDKEVSEQLDGTHENVIYTDGELENHDINLRKLLQR